MAISIIFLVDCRCHCYGNRICSIIKAVSFPQNAWAHELEIFSVFKGGSSELIYIVISKSAKYQFQILLCYSAKHYEFTAYAYSYVTYYGWFMHIWSHVVIIVCVPAKCACMNMGSCGRVCSVMYAEAHAIWTSNTEASTR